MHSKHHIFSIVAIISLAWALGFGTSVRAQVPWTPSAWGCSDTSIKYNYGIYEWPVSPCPEVQIKQKHNHTPLKQYRAEGWDTVIDCETRRQGGITLSCIPYIPTQKFNGQYTVDSIPYDPPDPTFSQGKKMPVSTDDDFAADTTQIPFDFFFFGIQKNAFVLGANGLITFDTTAKGRYCPWEFNATLPWTNSKNNVPEGLGCTKNNMRDAIYGIYEDTHPIASYLHGDQGIYYGIQGEYPCRKIIASWNGIPTFPGSRNQNNRCTYQIVCYEGSNIVEVHVKRRGVNPNWQGGRGLLGIQNATGAPQVNDGIGSSTMYVRPGAPAAYYPVGYNLLTSEVDSVAFRFTPQNNTETQYTEKWYRLFDNDSTVELSKYTSSTPDAQYDTNGYYFPLHYNSQMPFLTRAVVNPSCVSRYIFHLYFRDAAQNEYNISDTIVVGIDTANNLTLRPTGASPTEHEMSICAGQNARMTLEYPELQDTTATTLTLMRINGGDSIILADSLLTFGQLYLDEETKLKRIPLILEPEATASSLHTNKIDTILVKFHVEFVSTCEKDVEFLVWAYPSYDTVVDTGICMGESFTWSLNQQTYTASTTSPQVTLRTSLAQCDSVVHLHLTVSDTSHTIYPVSACKPYTWDTLIHGNGHTYYETNTATMATDTVHLLNAWGCDSTVQLAFTMNPMTPLIDASLDYFDFNNLNVVLTDVSIGGSDRIWLFPTGEPQYGQVAYYTAPYNIDSAVITLIEYSPYGCIDTAYVNIPFRRDVIWAPNAFTPDIPDGGNDHFHSVSTHLLKEQTLIYNRFGELVFHCEEIDCQWDGTDANGNPCPQGTYVYVIRYTTIYAPHETQMLKGSVTLIR